MARGFYREQAKKIYNIDFSWKFFNDDDDGNAVVAFVIRWVRTTNPPSCPMPIFSSPSYAMIILLAVLFLKEL